MIKEAGCKFIRINPCKENFNIYAELSRIQNHIITLLNQLKN